MSETSPRDVGIRRTALRVVAPVALALALFASGSAVRADPATFNAVSGYGTRLSGGSPISPYVENILPALDGPFFDPEESEVQMEDIALATDVEDGPGFRRLGFTLRLRNTGPGYYEEAGIEWERVGPEWQGVGVNDANGFMPDLVPNGTTTRAQPFEVRVPSEARDAAVADVLAGKHLRPAGIELFQFKNLAVGVDAATDDAYLSAIESPFGGADAIRFEQMTPLLASLSSGTLLVESAYVYPLMRPGPGDEPRQFLSNYVAAAEAFGAGDYGKKRETKIFLVASVVTDVDDTVVVSGRNVNMMDFLDVGTFHQRPVDAIDQAPGNNPPLRDIYRPPFGDCVVSASNVVNTGDPPLFMAPPARVRGAERIAKGLQGHSSNSFGFGAIHVPFNHVEIARGVRLDGEAVLDALNVEMKVRFRHLILPKITVKLATKAEITMRLTAGAHRKNLFEKEIDLFSIPLPGIVFSIGPVPIDITPIFKAKVGAVIDAPTEVIIPIHGSYEAGCVMICDLSRPVGDQVKFRAFKETHPLEVSDPLLNDSLAFTAEAYFESGVDVLVNHVAGPSFGARLTAKFELDPTAPRWWSLDFDFQTFSKMRLTILGFEVPDLPEFLSDLFSLPGRYPTSPMRGSGLPGGSPPGSFDPVSGGETRWARAASLSNPGTMRLSPVAGTPEDVFALVDAGVVSPPLLRIGAKGDVVWSKNSFFIRPQRMTGTPDGGLVFVTDGSPVLVCWLDGDGNSLAARTFRPLDAMGNPEGFTIGEVLSTPAGETYVVGAIQFFDFSHDPFVAKYDANHDLVWFRSYRTPGHLEQVIGAAFHPSGDLILCGQSDGPSPFEPASAIGGLLLRIRPDGTPVWGVRALAPVKYFGVTCSPEGAIFATGQFGHTLNLDWPTLLVGKHEDQHGFPETLVTIGEDMAGSLGRDPDLNGNVLEAGLTEYDRGNSITWTPNGLIVSGVTALETTATLRAPIVLCMSERLVVRWWAGNDSPGTEDNVFDMVPTAQGILTAGRSGGVRTPGGDTAPVLFTKFPLEGKVELSAGNTVSSAYVIPSVFAVPDHNIFYPGIATPPQGYFGTEQLDFVGADHAVASATVTPPVFADLPIDYSAPLQKDPRDLPEVPEAYTDEASFTRSTATFRGGADPAGLAGANAYFEWGTDRDALTNTTPAVRLPTTDDEVPIVFTVTGLMEEEGIYYRARLDAGESTAYGEIRTVVPDNRPPGAGFDRDFKIAANVPVVLPLLANDVDLDGDRLTIVRIEDAPEHGTVTIAADGSHVIYDPDDGFSSIDNFSYVISDGYDESQPGLVVVSVGLRRFPFSRASALVANASPLPGAAAQGTLISSFGTPAISDDGALAATATFRAGRKNVGAIYLRYPDGHAASFGQFGTEPPGLPGATFAAVGDPALSPHGVLAFTAKVRGPGITGSNDEGLWTTLGGGLPARVLVENDEVLWVGHDAIVKRIVSYSVRDTEILALLALKPGGAVTRSNDTVLVRLTASGRSVVAREGSARNATDPAIVSAVSALVPAPGSLGQGRSQAEGRVLARLSSKRPARSAVVEFDANGAGTTLFATGAPAPEAGGAAVWTSFGLPCTSPTGNAAVLAEIEEAGIGVAESMIVFRPSGGGAASVAARAGDDAPGTTARFASFLDPVVNDDGHVAFVATLAGTGVTRTNASSLWAGAPSAPGLVARAGSAVPGAQADVFFGSFTSVALPGLGGPLFLAQLTGAGTTAQSRTALFAQTSTGILTQLARTGTVEGSRTVTGISLLGATTGPSGATRSFNALGQAAARLTFDDGSQELRRFDVP